MIGYRCSFRQNTPTESIFEGFSAGTLGPLKNRSNPAWWHSLNSNRIPAHNMCVHIMVRKLDVSKGK